jgi:PIN domain nuclease of toxin-antitoxin system
MTMVHDASAVLALLYDEPGADAVEAVPGPRLISAVNLAEVVQRLHRDFETAAVKDAVAALGLTVIAADGPLAMRAGLMARETVAAGLSLGDRFCLALAQQLGLPALTADRVWLAVGPALGVVVQSVR